MGTQLAQRKGLGNLMRKADKAEKDYDMKDQEKGYNIDDLIYILDN